MSVYIKNFSISMEVKNKGIELEVKTNEQHLGDLIVSKAGIEWCDGKIHSGNGKKFTWTQFVKMIADNKK